jgi:hypothetical protein
MLRFYWWSHADGRVHLVERWAERWSRSVCYLAFCRANHLVDVGANRRGTKANCARCVYPHHIPPSLQCHLPRWHVPWFLGTESIWISLLPLPHSLFPWDTSWTCAPIPLVFVHLDSVKGVSPWNVYLHEKNFLDNISNCQLLMT